jgi:hypothetical protein
MKRNPPVARVTAKERSKQFKDNMYEDGDVLFCKFCQHSVDFVHVDTIRDHLISKKYRANKDAQTSKGICKKSSKQVTLNTTIASKDMREEFILDYLKLCTLADIPLVQSTVNKQGLYHR